MASIANRSEGRAGRGSAVRAVVRTKRLKSGDSGLPSTVLGAPATYAVLVPLLPRVVTRPVALGLAGVACALGVAGCAQFDKALGQSTVQVYFSANATPTIMLKVMKACNNVNPHVKAEANPPGIPPEDIEVIYNTTGASDAQLAQLEECLNKFPQVTGIDPQDSSDYS